MQKLTHIYEQNVELMDRILRVEENFDILKKVLTIGQDELTLYYIDGFIKDGLMEKLMIYFLSLKSTKGSANEFLTSHAAYDETEGDDGQQIIKFIVDQLPMLFPPLSYI